MRALGPAAIASTLALAATLAAPVAPALGDSCPNAQFRTGVATGLPDCRAYELVSPPGQPVNAPTLPGAAVSADGHAILYKASVAYPGAKSSPFINDYRSARGEGGWSTTDLAASGTDVTSTPFLPLLLLDAPADLSSPVFALPFALSPGDQDGDPIQSAFHCPDFTGCDDLYVYHDGSWGWVSQNGQTKTSPAPIAYAGEAGDQSHILFEEQAALTPNASGLVSGANALYDRAGGNTVLVGVTSGGQPVSACGSVIAAPPVIGLPSYAFGPSSLTYDGSQQPSNAVSHDGSRVFFESPDPAAGGASSCSTQQGGAQPVELYLRQGNATTTEVSLSQKSGAVGTPAPDGATFQVASADGSEVLFTSPDQLTDDATGTAPYLYEYDVATSRLTFLADSAQSLDNSEFPGEAPGQPSVVGTSSDLSYVYFFQGTVLSVWHAGQITVLPGSQHSQQIAGGAELTPDGTRLVFVAPGSDGYNDVYLYDAPSNVLTCLSCGPAGASPVGESSLGQSDGYVTSRVISDDGSRVFFQSPNQLLPQAVNGQQDVYEWEDGKLYLISDPDSSAGSELIGAGSTGDDVFFETADTLTPQDDSDGDTVIYDARVGGGLAGPPAPPPACENAACQGPPAPPPGPPTIGSVTFHGPGNQLVRARHAGKRARRESVSLTRVVHTSRFVIRARATVGGRITVTGHDVHRVSRLARRPGAYRITLRLTHNATTRLARRHRLRIHLHLTIEPLRSRRDVHLLGRARSRRAADTTRRTSR